MGLGASCELPHPNQGACVWLDPSQGGNTESLSRLSSLTSAVGVSSMLLRITKTRIKATQIKFTKVLSRITLFVRLGFSLGRSKGKERVEGAILAPSDFSTFSLVVPMTVGSVNILMPIL